MTEGYTDNWSLTLDDSLFEDSGSFTAGFSFDDWLDHDQTGARAFRGSESMVALPQSPEPHEHASPSDSQWPDGPRLSATFFQPSDTAPLATVDTQNVASLATAHGTLPQESSTPRPNTSNPKSRSRICPCGESFPNLEPLYNHCKDTGHAAFLCTVEDCGSTFSRRDVLHRHMIKHNTNAARFPCHLCKLHRGADAFKRKDHLTQHMRNYHHVDDSDEQRVQNSDRRWCTHLTCPDSREARFDQAASERFAFSNPSEHTAHMKKVHNESPYPCTVLGCDRVEGKGYFRKRDLLKHQKKSHPERYAGGLVGIEAF